ncbi:MAG: carbohydrate ABC transporter permease [Eubacteriales bacterium]|nr:carbohydrate ABC transporter permease [Eubacteriales bacterium]
MTALVKPGKSRRKNRIREGSVAADVIMYAISVFVIFITLYPMYYILIISLSAPEVAITMKVYVRPIGLNLNAYQVLLKNTEFWHAYKNTLIYLVPNTVLPLVTATLVAYPLSYKKLMGRKALTWFLLVPMYFSGGLIPSFLLVQKLGMYGSPLALIIPGCYSISNIILVRSFFRTVPDELREAACIDGANIYQILLNVYLPSSVAIFAVIAIREMVSSWNSWYSAYIYLPKRTWQPLQLYLRRMLTLEATVVSDELSEEAARDLEEFKLAMAQLKYAMIILSVLPILCVYPYFQRFFIKGVMLGSLKE